MATDKGKKFIADVAFLRKKRVIVKDIEIVDKTGFSKPVISNYLSGRVAPRKNFIAKFYEVYAKDLRNESFQNTVSYVNEPGIKYNSAIRMNGSDMLIMEVPLVNKFAYAGYLSGYGDAEYVESLPKMPFVVEKEYKGNYVSFEVKGDSMFDGSFDGYAEGDIVLCREIARHYWSSKLHIKKWDFVIVTKNDGILIKKIVEHKPDKGEIKLHSLNDMYNDTTMNLKDVAQIFNVVQVARKK